MCSLTLRGPTTATGRATTTNISITMYRKSAKNRCRTGWRNGVWSCASTTASTYDETAEDPAHSEIKKPSETTSPRAVPVMSRMVGSMIWSTTFEEKKLRVMDSVLLTMAAKVSGPNSGATYARVPSSPSNSGGVERQVQKPASADSEKIESSHALDRVLRPRCRMWWRDGLARWSLISVQHCRIILATPTSPREFGNLGCADLDDGVLLGQSRLVLVGV